MQNKQLTGLIMLSVGLGIILISMLLLSSLFRIGQWGITVTVIVGIVSGLTISIIGNYLLRKKT